MTGFIKKIKKDNSMLSSQSGHGEVWGYRGREERRGGSQLHALQKGTKSLYIFIIFFNILHKTLARIYMEGRRTRMPGGIHRAN